MSRIDEALKRAERETGAGESIAVASVAELAPHASSLDRYAAERPVERPVERPAERPSGAAVRSVVRERPHVVTAPARVAPEQSRAHMDPTLSGKLVTTPETDAVSVEQYRRLAAVLEEIQAQRGLKSLMVSSAFPREGKTLTVTNLALTFSDAYKRRVLIIDADLRRPSVHEAFGLSNDAGLVDALRSNDGDFHLQQLSPTLTVLPAGRAARSPLAALSSDRMKSIVAELSSRFDWVLIDTPPVGLLSDAQLVSRVSDGVLFVIAAGATPYAMAQRAINEIGTDRIVGTVLNRVEPHALPVRSYYGRYYTERQ